MILVLRNDEIFLTIKSDAQKIIRLLVSQQITTTFYDVYPTIIHIHGGKLFFEKKKKQQKICAKNFL